MFICNPLNVLFCCRRNKCECERKCECGHREEKKCGCECGCREEKKCEQKKNYCDCQKERCKKWRECWCECKKKCRVCEVKCHDEEISEGIEEKKDECSCPCKWFEQTCEKQD